MRIRGILRRLKSNKNICFTCMEENNHKESVKRGLGKNISDKFATKCSLTGRRGKHAIQNLTVITVLKDATRKRFLDVADKEFEFHIAAWLRQSQLRYDWQQLKKKGPQDAN